MADYVTKIRTSTGDKQIDYNALANLPTMDFVPISEKGVLSGVATLDSSGKVPSSQLPSMDYVPTTEKGAAGGVASLDSSGKVPSGQLPSMNYIPTSQKGAASGVASLDSTGKVPSGQLNLSSSVTSTSTTTAANSAAVKAAYDKASSTVVTTVVPSVTIENGTIGTNGLRCFRTGNIVLICGAVSQMSCTGSSYGSLIISGIPEPVNTGFYSFRAWGGSGNSEVKQNSVYYQTASSVRLSPDISSDTTQIQITLVYATT